MTFVRDPFVHFFLLGCAIFGWFYVLNPTSETPENPKEIKISERVYDVLQTRFEAQMQRPPTEEEALALVNQYIRQEILVREALALGLDQGDGIVRNRMVQKMAFLTESAAQSAVPDDATLKDHIDTYPDRFKSPAKITFEQVGISPTMSQTEVAEILTKLNAGETPPADGISSMLMPKMERSDQIQVDGAFGRGMYSQVIGLVPGEWGGPVISGYGRHVVRVTEVVEPTPLSLDKARDKAIADWRNTLAVRLRETNEATLLSQYTITRPDADTLQRWIAQ